LLELPEATAEGGEQLNSRTGEQLKKVSKQKAAQANLKVKYILGPGEVIKEIKGTYHIQN
jgi:hypothetical protein